MFPFKYIKYSVDSVDISNWLGMFSACAEKAEERL